MMLVTIAILLVAALGTAAATGSRVAFLAAVFFFVALVAAVFIVIADRNADKSPVPNPFDRR